ncbi:hypothetical protein U1Q18_052126 [Sarracenia purpurea var. burkii]
MPTKLLRLILISKACIGRYFQKVRSILRRFIRRYGIDKKFIGFGKHNHWKRLRPSAKPNDDCWEYGIDPNFSSQMDTRKVMFSNPEDMVQQALNDSRSRQQQLRDVFSDLRMDGSLHLDIADLVDALSLPTLMIAGSVDNTSRAGSAAGVALGAAIRRTLTGTGVGGDSLWASTALSWGSIMVF